MEEKDCKWMKFFKFRYQQLKRDMFSYMKRRKNITVVISLGNISNVTRRDIFELFKRGITEDSWFIEEIIFYPYYGRLEIVDFLKRLYDLSSWESRDSRVANPEEEITMHTYNGDYSDDWIFDDERFHLLYGTDSILLDFLCEVFHPEVRDESNIGKST